MNEELIISDKYEPLFEWLSCSEDNPLFSVDTVVCTGGRYSQKSFGVGTFTCVAAKDFVHRVLYTRYTLTSAHDSIIPEFTEKIDLLNCHNSFEVTKDRIIGTQNESKIVFKGIKTSSGNQTASLKSLKGFSMFVLEEAEEMPSFDNWDKIKKSIRALDVRNLNILILNPTTKTHWIYTELFEDKGVQEGFNGIVDNVLYIHTTYLDMKREYIPDSIYNDFEDKRKAHEIYTNTPKEYREKLDPKITKKALYYKHVVLGGWLDNAEGVVFENWSWGEFDDSLPFGFGQDFGFSVDPTTLVKIAVNKKHKKIYVKECYGKSGLSTNDIYLLNLRYAGHDNEIIADSAEPRLISEVSSKGLNIKSCIKGAGSVTAGIKALQEYEIIVSPCSTEIGKEFNNYVWHDKKSSTPIDAFNHRIDPIRYYAYPIISDIKLIIDDSQLC
jgi:phage terminase large subunit